MKRSCIHPIILTTLPHFFSIGMVVNSTSLQYPGIYIGYCVVIGCSSILSVIWHHHHEPKSILFWLDYTFAGIWTLYDCILASLLKPSYSIILVCMLNIITIIFNQLVDYLAKKELILYETGHSIWHLFSASKSILVAYLLS